MKRSLLSCLVVFLLITTSYAQQTELLNNPNFNNGTDGWWFSGAEVTTGNGEVYFNITNPGTNTWDIQLGQGDFTIKKGYKYTLNWRAKREADYAHFIVQLNHDPYTYIFGQYTTHDGSWQESSIVFEQTGDDITGVGIAVQMGGSSANATFDYISLIEEIIPDPGVDSTIVNTNPGIGPVSYFGEMKANGNRILGSRTQTPVQGKGISFFWSLWGGEEWWTTGAVNSLAQDWNAEIVRAAMSVEDHNDWRNVYGFLDPLGREMQIGWMETIVEAAIANDIYVIIDYHSHYAHNHTQNAKEFFGYMAEKYGQYDHVIFELYNEPIDPDWQTIKTYAEAVIDTIRMYSDNLVIVGTENYSQRVDNASLSPIDDPNVAYVFHFYASHGGELRNIVANALNNNVPVFCSEWGNIYVWGDKIDQIDDEAWANSDAWHQFMDENKISSANWAVLSTNMSNNNPNEACLFDEQFGPVSRTGEGWADTTIMTPSGKYVYNMLKEWAQSATWRDVMDAPGTVTLLSPVTDSQNLGMTPTLTWNAVENASGYTVQVATDLAFNNIILTETVLFSNSTSISGLLEGQKYHWRVKASNAAGTGSWSNVSNFVTVLNAPTSLNAQKTNQNEITLSWNDNSANEDGCIIERKESSQPSFSMLTTLTGSPNNYIDNTANTSQSYSYRVKAYTSFTESEYSNEASFSGSLAAPQNLLPASSQTNLSTELTFTWSAVANALNYNFQLTRNPIFNSTFTTDTTLTETSVTVSKLSEGQKYYWRVKSISNAIESGWSSINDFITKLSAPTNLELENDTTGGIALSWTDNSQGDSGYYIERKDEQQTSFAKIDSIDGNRYVDNNVIAGNTYSYRIKAYSDFIESEYSNEASLLVVSIEDDIIPTEFSMHQNYPNPFNPSTKIKFTLPQAKHVKLIVYDLLGREVQTLVNRELEAGFYEYDFNAINISGGVYFYRIKAGEFVDIKKMILLK